MREWILAATLCAIGVIVSACAVSPRTAPLTDSPDPPIIIFETDFGGDADDLGAIAMLHKFADEGVIDLQAIILWSNEQYAVPALAAVNQYYGRAEMSVGVRETAPWRTDWNHTKIIADEMPYNPAHVEAVEPAVALYRKLLAAADDQSVTIVTVGPLANIQNLLQSPADSHSPLSGQDLVDQKVERFVIMGGQFPEGRTTNGAEWNFDGNMPGVTQYVLSNILRPIVFSGFEVGDALRVGRELNDHPKDTPIYLGYKYFSEHAPWMKTDYKGEILDNASFDQTAVMYAALGNGDAFWTLSQPGTLTADADGYATWSEHPDGKHRYMILTDRTDHTEAYILEGMTHLPTE
ncbi:MAG: nucleoside hydrolase [Hyphomonas sp.]|nr:nucleoside hydrolase [Hyphomonas sp.]